MKANWDMIRRIELRRYTPKKFKINLLIARNLILGKIYGWISQLKLEVDMTLTVAMITLNEEKNLEITLKSVQDFADEIVIVDSGSTDRTKEIAKKIWSKICISTMAWLWSTKK